MTNNDKELIKRAEETSRWYYFDIINLIKHADTEEAIKRLEEIYFELRDLAHESL